MAFADILEVHLSGFLVVLEEEKEKKWGRGRGRGRGKGLKRKRERGGGSEERKAMRRRKRDGGQSSLLTSPLPVVRATPTSSPSFPQPQLQQQEQERQSEEDIETHLKTLTTPRQINDPLPSISSTQALQMWKLAHEYATRSLEFGHHRSPFPHMTLADILLKRFTLEGVVIEKEKERGDVVGLEKRRNRRGEMKKWLEEAESNCFVTLNLLLRAGLSDFEKKKSEESEAKGQGEFVSIFDSNKRNQLTAVLSLLALASFQFAILEEESLEDEGKEKQEQVLSYAIKSLNAFNLALRVRFLLRFQDHQKLAASESRSISALYNWREFLMCQEIKDQEGGSGLSGSGLGEVVGGRVVGGLLLLPLPNDFKVEELGDGREGERTEMVDLLNNLASSCLIAARTVGFALFFDFILLF